MTEVESTSRFGSQVGGHQTTLRREYLDRSRSRETLVRRGEEYGRSGRGGQELERDPRVRGREDKTPAGAGPEKEMHGGKH
jgi:hypothetical protein